MRTVLPALLVLLSFVVGSVSETWDQPPDDQEASGDDQEASGDDLEMEGSGSGAGVDVVVSDEKSARLGSSKETTASVKSYKSPHKPLKEPEVDPRLRELTIVQESRSFMDSTEVLAGVIAGGVGGLVLALLLGGLLIYKWNKKKDSLGYVRGRAQEQYVTEPSGAHRGEDGVLV